MPVQRRRHTPGRGKRRRSHLALKPIKILSCPKCKKPVLPHRACSYCGYYRGKEAINVERARKRRIEREKLTRS